MCHGEPGGCRDRILQGGLGGRFFYPIMKLKQGLVTCKEDVKGRPLFCVIWYNKVLLNIRVKPYCLMRFSLKRHKNGKNYYPKIFATLSAAFFRISSV
jgi:hypothetical protein